jgi:hypothetical protein
MSPEPEDVGVSVPVLTHVQGGTSRQQVRDGTVGSEGDVGAVVQRDGVSHDLGGGGGEPDRLRHLEGDGRAGETEVDAGHGGS